LRAVLLQRIAHRLGQRQIGCQPGQRLQIDRAGRHFTEAATALHGGLPFQVDAGRTHPDAVLRHQLQLPRTGCHTGQTQMLGTDAARQAHQIEQRQFGRQTQFQVGQRQFSGDRSQLGAIEIRPGPRRAAPLGQLERIIDPCLPDRHVRTFERREQLARSGGPVAFIREQDVAAQFQRFRKRFRWPGKQAEAVMLPRIVEPHVDLRKLQRRRARPRFVAASQAAHCGY
jgi:hypothetical protein